MNYIVLCIEMLLCFLLIVLLYKLGKKDGLFLCISLFSSVLCVMLFKVINVFDFDINMGIPFIVSLFILNNIIIHRYGMDEVKRIIITFGVSYIATFIIVMLTTLITSGEYNNGIYDVIFGYNLSNIRYFVGGVISIGIVMIMGSNIYDSIRKSKNNIVFNNVGSLLIILFIESIIFVNISHIGSYSVVELFGMIVIRYLIGVVIGGIGVIPAYFLLKRKDK